MQERGSLARGSSPRPQAAGDAARPAVHRSGGFMPYVDGFVLPEVRVDL